MPKKNRSSDSKRSADKHRLNPPDGGKEPPAGAPSSPNPSGVDDGADPSDRVGQFTARGAPGLQKK